MIPIHLGVLSKIRTIIDKLRTIQKHILFYKKDKHLLKEHDYPIITRQELQQIRDAWPCFKYYGQKDLTWFRIYKKEHGFSPYFIDALQIKYVLEKTNPLNQFVALVNKALCDVYLPEIPFPKVYVRKLNGSFFDGQMNYLTLSDAVDYLTGLKEFIVKPALDTKGGVGVKKVVVDKLTFGKKEIEQILGGVGENAVVQEVLCQEAKMSAMNPTSINCCRITTLYINGKFGFSSILKVGKMGSKVDNWNSSYFIGMNKDGSLLPYGYDNKLNKVALTDNGIIFEGVQVPFFDKMVELTEKCHKKLFPNCGIIGWDIMVDNDTNPRVIETNILRTGVVGEQLASGTFFEEFRDIICEKLMKK